MSRRIKTLAPTRRRGFLKAAGALLAAPTIPAAVRYAVYEQLVGTAKAEEMLTKVPTYFVEINLRDQFDFMHVVVPPGLATNPNIITGGDGNKCTLYHDQSALMQHPGGLYLTPDSAALQPHIDSIAVCELNELCVGAIHGHEAVNAMRSPGRTKQSEPGKSEMWLGEPGFSEQGNDYFYSSTPTPASLHNLHQKQITPGLRNGITMKYISRFHTICHYAAGEADGELERVQTRDYLFQTFPDTVEDLNALSSVQEAQLLSSVLSRVDDGFFGRYGMEEAARTKHATNLDEAVGEWFSPDNNKIVSMPLTEEETAYWAPDVPDQVGDNIKAQIWEAMAWTEKLLVNDIVRTVSIEWDYLDVHETRSESVVTTMAQQISIPLARLITRLKEAGIYDQTVIAVYSADGGRSPAANSYGNSGKNTFMICGRNVNPGYYGDVSVAGPNGDGHNYGYHVPDPVTGVPQAPVTDNSNRLDGAYSWRTLMKALEIPDELAGSYPDTADYHPLSFMLTV